MRATATGRSVYDVLMFELDAELESGAPLDVRGQLHRVTKQTFSELAAADPGNAGWQRDRVVSNYKLAVHLSQVQDPAAAWYWRNCHIVLLRMRAGRMFPDQPLAELLEYLDSQ